MNMPEKSVPPLLTLREAARKLGVPNSVFVDLVYLHPPVIDVTLVGRAPRVDGSQLARLGARLSGVVMELMRVDASLLGLALTLSRSRSRSAGEDGKGLDPEALRHIIAREAAQLRAAQQSQT